MTLQTFPLRPGITLYWGENLASALVGSSSVPAPDLAADAALLAFVLSPDARRDVDRMILIQAAALSTARPVPSHAFHVTIALTAPALHDLLRDDKSPGATLVRNFATPSLAPSLNLPLAPSPPLCVSPSLSLPLTPAARLAVESIRRCPFAGACRSMALTARCHDLLVEFLTAVSATTASTPSRPPLPTRTLDEQIRAAADFLAQHLDEAPTLAALAREIGLSETTLKRGFHQVFSTTVFGYLRTRRMEHAHALLQSGEATVLETAALVGYSNPSNFAAAFRRHFGLNPKAFQLTVRR